MLARVGSALRARPFVGACTTATVKTSAADLCVQTVIEGRSLDEIDRQRLATFSVFGFVWMGAGQYVLYCRVFEALLPARTVLHSAGKMALDQFCHVPLLFLPVFYSVDAWLRGEGLEHVRQKYEREAWATLKVNWVIWVPASFVSFAIVPLHWRIPYVSAVSFVSTWVFSVLQARVVVVVVSTKLPARNTWPTDEYGL